MANAKKVTVFLSRSVTLNRRDQEPLKLNAGHNIVDEDVAKHPFVKAHLMDEPADNPVASALQAKIEELGAEIVKLRKEVEEKDAVIAAYAATAPKGK